MKYALLPGTTVYGEDGNPRHVPDLRVLEENGDAALRLPDPDVYGIFFDLAKDRKAKDARAVQNVIFPFFTMLALVLNPRWQEDRVVDRAVRLGKGADAIVIGVNDTVESNSRVFWKKEGILEK